jgi:hypothetical protein
MESKPAVILLYNPSAYEIYRDIRVKRDPKYDEISAFQIEAQRSYAKKNGWILLDLTDPLRNKLQENKLWIYGRYDAQHWSHSGTVIVADVLTAELLRVIGNKELSAGNR